MTLHTPVVFSDDPDVAAAARQRNWRVVERHPDNPSVLRLRGVDVLCAIPQPKMGISTGSLDADSHPVWNYVLNWLERFVHRPMPVVAANDYATELGLWAARTRGWPLGALVHGTAPVSTPTAISLFTAADGFFFPDASLGETFTSTWPAPVTELGDTPLLEAVAPLPVERTKSSDKVTRALLVAYYAGPSPTVGVQRVNYWFEELERLSGGEVTVDLALATPWPDAPARVHHVKDFGPANLTTPGQPLQPFAQAYFEEAHASAYSIHLQAGGHWHWALQEYFSKRADHYDVVILSGNPYGYFDFAQFAKQHWYAHTILDYRDPFVGNPRSQWQPAAREAAVNTEKGWNIQADVVLSVNDVCASVTIPGGPDTRIEVIPNGYDERVPAPRRVERAPDSPIRFGHAGQLYRITPPDNLVQAIADTSFEFHQIGAAVPGEHGENVVNHGRMSRPEVLDKLAGFDCGVTFAGDSGVETPTKLFDYLAVGIDVLVLHKREPESSAMHSLLAGVEGIHWVPDDVDSIRDWLASYEPSRSHREDRADAFTRRATTEKLLGIIRELGDHSFTPPAWAVSDQS